MSKKENLVVVESPSKAGTIENYLGSDYKVVASYGHVRDLPKSKLGVNVEKNFEPEYIVPRKNSKNVTALKKEAKGVKTIWLATDPDREGEAIAWHVSEVLKADNNKAEIKRITFHEITKPAILEAIKVPTDLDEKKIDAQQARRVLDRLVGYTLSPLLWQKLFKGLSAGRVQSVALKFIVDRENERKAFKSKKYWLIEATIEKAKKEFIAKYAGEKKQKYKKDEHFIEKVEVSEKTLEQIKKAKLIVDDVDEQDQFRHPKPPFITSTLQQTAANALGFSAKKTMVGAQKLYESGHITYMRTDSHNLATSAVQEIRAVIQKEYGDEFVPEQANAYKSKRSAQEAHEAIRPTHVRTLPETVASKIGKDEGRLYDLIWRRAVASQMKPAKVKKTSVSILADKHLLKANGLRLLFEGHFRALGKTTNEVMLPILKKGDKVDLKDINAQEHETEPPARFNEASLIKILEESGVGRPSTYAPTISTLYNRNYIIREGKALVPQDIGFKVIELLAEHFPNIVDVEFTAKMEEDLDEVAEGNKKWQKIIGDFYGPFSKLVAKKTDEIEKVVSDEETDEKCPKCGKPIIIKHGRFGKFKACTGFPDCKHTENIADKVDVTCPICGKKLVAKRTRRGKTFFGCEGYPKCDFALWGLDQKSLDKKLADLASGKTYGKGKGKGKGKTAAKDREEKIEVKPVATPHLEQTKADIALIEQKQKQKNKDED